MQRFMSQSSVPHWRKWKYLILTILVISPPSMLDSLPPPLPLPSPLTLPMPLPPQYWFSVSQCWNWRTDIAHTSGLIATKLLLPLRLSVAPVLIIMIIINGVYTTYLRDCPELTPISWPTDVNWRFQPLPSSKSCTACLPLPANISGHTHLPAAAIERCIDEHGCSYT